ncbi:MAG: TA system VapC family ribonuclease toxin [Nocardioidaceae bacterium]
MLLLDVDVLVHAFRRESPRHEAYTRWLEGALTGEESVGLPEVALAGLLRPTTNHRIYRDPSTPEAALEFCDAVLDGGSAVRVRAGLRHWGIFCRLVRDHRLRANDVPDASLAALALENAATLVSTDRGLARFGGLRLSPPLP